MSNVVASFAKPACPLPANRIPSVALMLVVKGVAAIADLTVETPAHVYKRCILASTPIPVLASALS